MSEMPKEIWAGHKIGPRWSDTEDYWDYQGCTRYLRADEVEGLLREAAGALKCIDDTPVDGALWTRTWNADDWLTIRAGTVKRIRQLLGESDG